MSDRTDRGQRRRGGHSRRRDSRTREEMTIDELARRTGMTVRNIRAHQSRGLLPPPEVRGRTGYYGPDHIARIELIRELQADGLNLEAIRRLVDDTGGGTSQEVLRFTRAVREPFEDETPEIVDLSELAEQWGTGEPTLLERALELGLLVPLGDGRFEQISPRLARAGRELRDLGMEPEAAMDVVERLRRHADGVAEVFVELFLEQVWKPFEEAGAPPDRWPDVAEAIERLRPLASDALLAVFHSAMTNAVEEAFGRELSRLRDGD